MIKSCPWQPNSRDPSPQESKIPNPSDRIAAQWRIRDLPLVLDKIERTALSDCCFHSFPSCLTVPHRKRAAGWPLVQWSLTRRWASGLVRIRQSCHRLRHNSSEMRSVRPKAHMTFSLYLPSAINLWLFFPLLLLVLSLARSRNC